MESGIITGLLFIISGFVFLILNQITGFSFIAIGIILIFFSKNEDIIEKRKDLIKEKN
jgi:hypothetical protein